MDLSQAELLREILAGTGLPDDAAVLARALRRSTRRTSGLLITGPPDDEPWHLTAHLDDEARYVGSDGIKPRLLRWNVHPGDPEHLSHGISALNDAERGDSVLVVADAESGKSMDPLLERVAGARKRGAGVFALQEEETELTGLATEVITLSNYHVPSVSFDESQHLLSLAVGRSPAQARLGLRRQVSRLLDAWAGRDS
jgi:hypothetical protein